MSAIQTTFAFETRAGCNNPILSSETLHEYDTIIVYVSGGKDSIACLLHLLELDVPKARLEIHHHDIDGRERRFMDWPVTPSYCKKLAEELGLKIYYSWKVGGFKTELLRNNQPTQATSFEVPAGRIETRGGTSGKLNTRLRFPQVSADLNVRWCSAYLKIMVAETSLINQPRFQNSKTLVVSGERAEESAARAKYPTFEPDRADNRHGKSKRHIDRWRPIHGWSEPQIWDILKRWGIVPHPAYWFGISRCSCQFCIFADPNQWATLRHHFPERFQEIAGYEQQFGKTIHRTLSIDQLADRGQIFKDVPPEIIKASQSEIYELPTRVQPAEWVLPPGAYRSSAGPT